MLHLLLKLIVKIFPSTEFIVAALVYGCFFGWGGINTWKYLRFFRKAFLVSGRVRGEDRVCFEWEGRQHYIQDTVIKPLFCKRPEVVKVGVDLQNISNSRVRQGVKLALYVGAFLFGLAGLIVCYFVGRG